MICEADQNNQIIKDGHNPSNPPPIVHDVDKPKTELTERAATNQRKNQRSLGKQIHVNGRRWAHKQKVAKNILNKLYTIEAVDRKAVDKFVIANSFGKNKLKKVLSHKELETTTLYAKTPTNIEIVVDEEEAPEEVSIV